MGVSRGILLGGLLALSAFLALALRAPGLDSDQAINGLMGRHILEGEFPIFFYGQEHTGALENYLAAVSFFLFGASRLTLNIVPAVLALLLLFLGWRVTLESFGTRAAGWAVPFLVVAPPYVAYHYVLARSSYIETLVLGLLILLLTFRLLRPGGEVERQRRFLILALVAGLGLYTSFQIVHYLVVAGAVLWISDLRLPLRATLWRAAPAFLVGSAPFWLYNLQRGFESLSAPARHETGMGVIESARTLLLTHLPVIFGVRDTVGAPFLPFPLFFLPPLIFGVCILVAVGAHSRMWLRRNVAPGGVLLLLLLVTGGILCVGGYQQVSRYALPLYPTAVSLAAGGLSVLQGWRPAASGILGGALFLSLAVGQWQTLVALHPEKLRAYRMERERDRSLFAELGRRGLTRLYAFDYWLAPRLTFEARERIVVAEPFGDRYPRFTQMVDQAERPAYLFAGGEEFAEEGLNAAGIGFKKESLAGLVILHDFTPPPPAEPLRRKGWGLSSRPQGDVALAVDGDLLSRWTPGIIQQPGQFLEVDLGARVTLQGVGILSGLDAHDAPRGLAVEVSLDGRRWERVVGLRSFPPTFVWENGAPRMKPMGEFRVRFPPTEARSVRLIQTGEDQNYWWSVAEMFLYTTGGPSREPEPLRLARVSATMRDWPRTVQYARDATAVAPDMAEPYVLMAEGFQALGLPVAPPERRAEALERLGLPALAFAGYRSVLEELPAGSLRSMPIEGLIRSLDSLGVRGETGQWRTALAMLARASPPATQFGGSLRLLSLETNPNPIRAGSILSLTYTWEALSPPPFAPTIFVHLVGAGERLVNDHPLLHGLYPPDRWHRGERLRERYALAVPPTTLPGRYSIVVGVWFPKNGERLRVWRGWLPTRMDRLEVGAVQVLPGDPS